MITTILLINQLIILLCLGSSMPLPPISAAFDIDELDLLNPEDEDFCTIHPLSGKKKNLNILVPFGPNHFFSHFFIYDLQNIYYISRNHK